MKASEFKKILKPLVEQTVKEVLLNEGVLSKVVSEVAKGLNKTIVSESLQDTRRVVSNKDKDEAEKEYLKKNSKEDLVTDVVVEVPDLPMFGKTQWNH